MSGAELHAHAGTMGNDGGIVFIGDAGAAGVQHGEERHTPFFGHTGDFTEVGEHIALVVVAEVHMHGNAVGTTADGFLNGAYEAFLVGVAGQGRGSGKMDDQADVFTFAGSAEAAAAQPFVHQNSISAAVGHVRDCFVDILDAFDRTDRDAVIHRNNDGAAGFTIENALETNLLAEIHDIPSFVVCTGKLLHGSAAKRRPRICTRGPECLVLLYNNTPHTLVPQARPK